MDSSPSGSLVSSSLESSPLSGSVESPLDSTSSGSYSDSGVKLSIYLNEAFFLLTLTTSR